VGAELGVVCIGELNDPVDALVQCRELRPDIVVTDIRMPEVDGLELVRGLMRAGCAAEVVIISGHDDFACARQALQLGVVDYLLKPVNAGEPNSVLSRARDRVYRGRGLRDAPVRALIDARHPRIRAALRWIVEHFCENVGLTEAAAHVGMSPTYFSEIFKREVGRGFSDYLTELRIGEACRLLERGDLQIQEIAARIGYHNPNYFSRVFHRIVGRTPSEYEQDAAGGPPDPR
jgi:two-component system response regulator YesN